MSPGHYLNQCWLIINKVLWHYLRPISHKTFKISLLDISLKITDFRLQLNILGSNELISVNKTSTSWNDRKLSSSSLNSLATGRCSWYLNLVIFKLISRIDILSISCEIALRWTPSSLSKMIYDSNEHWHSFNTLRSGKMADLLQMTFSDAFLMKNIVFWLKFFRSFLRVYLMISQHWFR